MSQDASKEALVEVSELVLEDASDKVWEEVLRGNLKPQSVPFLSVDYQSGQFHTFSTNCYI